MDAAQRFESQDDLERMVQLFRYAQVGQCVSSVTHDVNNMLGAIMSYAELIGLEGALRGESSAMLSDIVDSARKCSDLINGLTSIARKKQSHVTIVDLNRMVEGILSLRQYDFRAQKIALEAQFERGAPGIVANRPQVEYALVYLIANALEAAEGERKRIRVTVRGGADVAQIVISNVDTPIDPVTQARMFEPFFTTKGGEHLGLGLFCARRIAESHGGTLEYGPAEGFVLTIPRDNPYTRELVG